MVILIKVFSGVGTGGATYINGRIVILNTFKIEISILIVTISFNSKNTAYKWPLFDFCLSNDATCIISSIIAVLCNYFA